MYKLYVHYRLDNWIPFYVGIGKWKRPYEKRKSHRNTYWRNVFQKHWLRVHIMYECDSLETIKSMEIKTISLYRKRYPGKITNITDWWEWAFWAIRSEEHKQRISDANKWKVYSEETKQKMRWPRLSYRLSNGTKSPMSDEHRKAISAAHAWKQISDEHKKILSDAASIHGKNVTLKKILYRWPKSLLAVLWETNPTKIPKRVRDRWGSVRSLFTKQTWIKKQAIAKDKHNEYMKSYRAKKKSTSDFF